MDTDIHTEYYILTNANTDIVYNDNVHGDLLNFSSNPLSYIIDIFSIY